MHLYRPPPVTSVHLVIDTARSLGISIVPLWGIDKITREFRVTEEGPDAWYNFAIMKLKVFTSNGKVLTLKGGAPRQRLVNNVV